MAYQTVTKWITPPEAEGIAREFEKQANIAYDLAAKLMRIKDDLDYNWEGNSKNKFMASYDGSPSKVNNYANELRARANEIRSIKVSVTENVWAPDPPAPVSASVGSSGGSFSGSGRHDSETSAGSKNSSSGKSQSANNKSSSGNEQKKNQWWDPFDWF